ncbi:MAG: isochorismatase family protein [Haloferacaceae archaeon]
MATDDKERIYESSGIGVESLEPGDSPAVVVVDLQTAFTDPDYALGSDLDDTVEATARVVDAAHAADVPVFYTRVVWREDYRDGAVFAIKAAPSDDGLVEGSEYLEIDPRLEVAERDHVIDKDQASAFFETELDTMLTFDRVDTTIVTGATTSGCVRATVVDACQHGYIPLVPEECVGDRAQDPHEANLFDMHSKYAEVVDLDDVLEYLDSLDG